MSILVNIETKKSDFISVTWLAKQSKLVNVTLQPIPLEISIAKYRCP